jgi:hypothetical protein
MRVLVIGSNRFDENNIYDQDTSEQMFKAATELGLELSKHEHTSLICSVATSTIDYHILQGVIKTKKVSQIELHIADNNDTDQMEKIQEFVQKVRIKKHSSLDVHVVQMEAMKDADALLILGGSTRSERTAIAAHMLGKTVIPIGSFGGAGKDVWIYASGRRTEFYKGAIKDDEIDKIAEPWKGRESAEFAVKMLEIVRSAEIRRARPPFIVGGTFAIMAAAMLIWVFFIAYGFNLTLPSALFEGRSVSPIGVVFFTVCFGGFVGASLKSLLEIKNGQKITWGEIGLDLGLGLGAGFVSAILYLVLQVAVTGKADSIQNSNDYVRISLLVSLVAIFAAMYLDAAFANFEAAKGSILSSEKKKPRKD